jgi:hypothetical protein
MQRVDETSAERFLEKVEKHRRDTLLRLFPDMPVPEAEELALGRDLVLLEKAERLAKEGCPTILAYRILRPLPGPPEPWSR